MTTKKINKSSIDQLNKSIEVLIENQSHLINTFTKISNNKESFSNSHEKLPQKYQTLIGILLAIVGLGINIGIFANRMGNLEANLEEHKSSVIQKIDKIDYSVHELQLRSAGNDEFFKSQQDKFNEIKKEISELKNEIKNK